jgi:SAM-dependent methyltransferase
MFRSIYIYVKSYPLLVLLWKIKCKIQKAKIPQIQIWREFFANKKGLEIGGPSPIFNKSSFLELYDIIESLDGVNFSNKTVWEGNISENNPYKFAGREGKQFICEGSELKNILNEQYDFILSCNNLEHIANPISAIYEWKRVIKAEGLILLILPNKKSNFDHERPYTTIEHLISDFKNNTTEHDLTHTEEILELHDLNFDPQVGNYENFKKRSLDNFNNRCLHHHVFNQELLVDMFNFCEMETVLQYTSKTDLFILARKYN